MVGGIGLEFSESQRLPLLRPYMLNAGFVYLEGGRRVVDNFNIYVEWDKGCEGYFFWDENNQPVGWWQTKDEAVLACEQYYLTQEV